MEYNTIFLFRVLILLQACISTNEALSVEHTAKYFTNVTLACDEKAVRPPFNAFLKYWILPNNTVLQWSHRDDGKHKLSIRPQYSLTINDVNDDDFGWYRCVILWDNKIFLVDSIEVGLFADYGDMTSLYKKRAIIGGIACGVTAVVVSLFCLTCAYLYGETDESKRQREERQAVYELDRTVQRFDEAIAGNGEIALRMSRVATGSMSDVGGYQAPLIPAKSVAIETISEQSSGFYDNKGFEIEHEAIEPLVGFDESASDFASSVFRDCGDQLL